MSIRGPLPPVLVLGAGYRAGPWVVRSLRAAGFPVIAVVSGGVLDGRTSACPRPRRCPSASGDPAGFVERVAEVCRREGAGVVLPVTEDATRAIALLTAPGDLGGAVVAGPGAAAYRALCDKSELGVTAGRAGVDHPETVTPAPGDPVPEIPLPAVVKPADSGEDADTELGVVAVRDPGALRAVLARYADRGARAVVQEMLTGPAWLVHGVRARGASPAPVMVRVETTWPRDAGVSSVSVVVPDAAALAATVTPLLDAVGYVGPWCMNAFERDGRLVVHDVNLRPPASVAIDMRAGLDMPALAALAALDLPLPAVRIRSVRYVNLTGELRALGAGLRAGRPRDAGAAAGEIVRAALGRDRVLDPSPVDPVWLAGLAARPMVRGVRRVRRLRSGPPR